MLEARQHMLPEAAGSEKTLWPSGPPHAAERARKRERVRGRVVGWSGGAA